MAILPPANWLEQDVSYNSQLSALTRALQNRQAGYVQQRNSFDTEYNQGLNDLGWDPGQGQWDTHDQLTRSGAATRAQTGDFASRGMLQSSGFGEARDNLNRSLNNELVSAERGRQGFLDSSQRDEVAFKDQNSLQQQQAKADALARRAAMYGG